jgi:hypothetical protein
MRIFSVAIAYSQGARSASVGPMIASGVMEKVFLGFDHRRLAKEKAHDILRQHWHALGCIRFKGKVDSILKAARTLTCIEHGHGSFSTYLNRFAIPRRISTAADIDLFWTRFDELRADLRRREMPFFNQTTSLLQLLLDLDYDSVKPDLIIMRLARRIGLVDRETGERSLREAVRSIQVYSVLRGVRAAVMDWYLLSFGGQTEAGMALGKRFCSVPDSCRMADCSIGAKGLCRDFTRRG